MTVINASKTKLRQNSSDIAMNALLYIILIIISLIMVLPFINIIATSFASPADIASSPFLLFPKRPTLNAYRYIFSTPTTIRSLGVSIMVTVCGVCISMTLTCITAYALSRKKLPGRKTFLFLVTLTMLLNPGMIANYLTFRAYGLLNSYAALLLPRAINVFYLLLLKNFFQNVPEEIQEAAVIDGCGTMNVFLRIVLPLSLPSLATFTLFYAVDNWNAFFDALLYISDPEKYPITIIMRQVVLMASGVGGAEAASEMAVSSSSVRMATIAIAVLPILVSYPALQKYFRSGFMAGSLKG